MNLLVKCINMARNIANKKEMSLIVKRIKELRAETGLSQYNLSLRAGLSISYLGMIERGEKDSPSMDVIISISKVLGVSLSEFFDGI